MLDPSEERLWLDEYAPDPGPVDRLKPPVLGVDVFEYNPLLGKGRNVGVVGRDTGVARELVVAVVPALLRPSVDVDVRDCGRMRAVAVLRDSGSFVSRSRGGARGRRDGESGAAD